MQNPIKTTQTIHLALTAGLILAYLFAGNPADLNLQTLPEVNSFNLPFLLLPLVAVIGGNFIYRSQLKKVDKKSPPDVLAASYQTACITRWALVDGSAFAVLFVAPEFTLVGLLLIAYLIYLRPSEAALKRDLNILR